MDTYPLLFSPRAYLEGEQRGYRSVGFLFGGEIKHIKARDLQPGTPLQSRNVSRCILPVLDTPMFRDLGKSLCAFTCIELDKPTFLAWDHKQIRSRDSLHLCLPLTKSIHIAQGQSSGVLELLLINAWVELFYQVETSLNIVIHPTHHHFIDESIIKDTTVQNTQEIRIS